MHVFYSRQDTLCKALLTERMQFYITGTNLLPCRAVAFILFVPPAVTLVLLIGYFLMLLTVQTVRQLRTIRISTGLLWFSWHRVHLLLGHRKSPRKITPTKARFCLVFHDTILAHIPLTVYTHFKTIYAIQRQFKTNPDI